jgi:hypothetical protein
MLCFDCAQEKREAPAVAVCVQCGRGLCVRHVVRQEKAVLERVPGGMGPRVARVPGARIRLLCGECAAAADAPDREQ